MFNYKRLAILTILSLLITAITISAPMSGTYNVGSGQTYTSLTGASGFFNAVNVNGLSGNVTALITSDITETGNVSLNQWTGTSYSVTISPSAATLRNLTGNLASGNLFNLNGCDNLIIDGRFGGSGRYLRFVNTSTSGSTFRFINDATNNTITYCNIEGTKASANSGIIDFSTTTGSNGNDNNTISYCLIHDYNGYLQNAIVSNGTTTTTARYNNNITISNNEIYNVYVNGAICTGILLLGGTSDWTITGNSFYQSTTVTPTVGTSWNMINVNTSRANNITISNNYFGGTSASCGGSALTVSGNASNAIYFIRFTTAGSTTASNVNGNTIANINFRTTPTNSSVGYFGCIAVESGRVNIGTGSGNTIGNSTSTGNIVLTYNGTADNLINRPIDHRSSGDISNNTIGSIQVGGNNNQTVRLECINYVSTPSGTTNITGNTIGSTTVSNSIEQTSSTFSFQLTGIHSAINTVTANISNNTVSNLRQISETSVSRIRGIYQNRSTSSPITMNNNIVQELYCASTNTGRYPDNCALIGMFSGSNSTTQTVSGNLISGLYGTCNADSYVMGFSFYNNVGKGIFDKNRIYNLNHSSTSGSPKIWGINAFWGGWNFYNNQITLTNGESSDSYTHGQNTNSVNSVSTNTDSKQCYVSKEVVDNLLKEEVISSENKDTDKPAAISDASINEAEIKGVHDEAEFACLYYYNSFYIGGNTNAGNENSWAYDRPLLSWSTLVTLRNNLFVNARTGGTGKHYAFGNEIGATNWSSTSSDYNVLIAANSSTIATWETNDQTIAQWRVSSSGDKHTWSTITSDIAPTSLFTDISTGNLKIQTGNYQAWIVSGKGLAISGQSGDYEGNTRPTSIAGGCTDIGSDELTATPPNNPSATADFAPGSGVVSTYSLWGRTLLTINWGTGGTNYPSAVDVEYYSGETHSGVVISGGYSNSYWSINPVGTLTGATYNIEINFSDNETYSINNPSTSTRLAKYNGSWEVFSVAGTGNWQTELLWASELIKTKGMIDFSDYALTDANNPLPVELCSFNAAINIRDVNLTWITCSEINNMGFDIEKRSFNSITKSFNGWEKAGFVSGNGTTNGQHTYSYSDRKLITGKYQYRLKQIDYNGNFEYHNLNTPSDVIIGNPKSADLFQNYPNPSNPTSKVDFQIPFAGKISLKVYDITGKEVTSLVDKDMDSGFYTVEFNGSNLASGVYFYRLIATSSDGSKFNKTMKLILIK
ncbi:MAG: hypothetical protein K8I03_09245 [Ignavibacteria bacterium]|nr:hypothetical protein [Ignavibacteria bacterium]